MSIAHLASWLVAVSLVPMLSAKLPPPKFLGRETMITRLRERYGRFVTWTLAHRRATMAGVVALLLLSFIPIIFSKKDMFDSGESRRMYLHYELNANYRLQDLKPAVAQVEAYLEKNRERFEIKSMYTYYTEQGEAEHLDHAHRRRQGQARRTRRSRRTCARTCRSSRSASSASISAVAPVAASIFRSSAIRWISCAISRPPSSACCRVCRR